MQLSVLDISEWQGNIDFSLVKAGGIAAVILRCGFTGYRSSLPTIADSMFEKHYQAATAVGLPVGVYYYSCATDVSKAVEEANFTLKILKNKEISYPVYFDTEDNHNVSEKGVNSQNQISIGRTKLTAIAKAFCSTIEAAGYTAGVYSNLSWLNNNLNMSELAAYECWVAQYAKATSYQGKYQMWQYTSSGSIAGIPLHFDLNYCYKDYANKQSAEEVASTQPKSPEQSNVNVGDDAAQIKMIRECVQQMKEILAKLIQD